MIHKQLYIKRITQWLLAMTLTMGIVLPTQAKTGVFHPIDSVPGEIFLPLVYTSTDNMPEPTPTPDPTPVPPTPPGVPTTYYISPTGSDSNPGTSGTLPWATFNHAWQYLYPGDTLILMDGVYYQSLNPGVRNGQPGYPITIRAQNDGKAIIDGQYQRLPVLLGNTWTGESGENPVGNYYVIEGIVARNSNDRVIQIDASHHNILRRVSAYNANPDTNSAVIGVIWPSAQYNLLEDIVVSGTGRKMAYIYKGEHNIFRRVFAAWKQWDGREFCSQEWPNGANIQIYNGSNNIIENSIAFGGAPKYSFSMGTNGLTDPFVRNQILGSMSVLAGREWDGDNIYYGTRPPPCTLTVDIYALRHFRSGFYFSNTEGAEAHDNILKDIFSWGNGGVGIGSSEGGGAVSLDHATIFGNLGLGWLDGDNPNLDPITEARLTSITNSNIEGTTYQGEGARLAFRYLDGVLMDGSNGSPAQPLWPWPMEDRIQAELGISITDYMTNLIFGTTNLEEIYP